MPTMISLAMAVVAFIVLAWALRLRRGERERSEARVAALSAAARAADPVHDSPAADADASTGTLMFGEEKSLPSHRRAFAAAAVGAAALTVCVLALAFSRAGDERRSEAARSAAPLELLAMDHRTRDGMLIVTGTIRPPAGWVGAELAVRVSAADASGTVFQSTRTRATIAASGTRSFTAALPAEGAARYRVSFYEGARPISHVDRRAASLRASR